MIRGGLHRIVAAVAVFSGINMGLPAGAQTATALQLATAGPRFLSTPAPGRPSVDMSDASALKRRVTLDVNGVTRKVALDAIGVQTGLRFFVSPSIPSINELVSIHAEGISVAAALTEILLGTGLDVELSTDGTVGVVPRVRLIEPARRSALPETGVVTGRVTDAKNGQVLGDVAVIVAGAGVGVVTGLDGRYTLKAVPVGVRTLTFRRLGYSAATRDVHVVGDSALRLDVALEPNAQVLDQVVTTVTGNQQLRSMGNAIGTINADSLMATTPITDLGDVINGRVAGVQLFLPGGLTGASPLINIRGISTFGNPQPLLYIDGIRVNNGFAAANPTEQSTALAAGRLNDLNPADIESIEIVRGPSAATLYGTDAANGVILVTTKRGTSGKAQWNAYAAGGVLTVDPDQFGYSYTGWGHAPDGTMTNSCTLLAVAAAQCVQDSITKFTPLRAPSLTPLGTGTRAEGGLQVSGSSAGTRYFASGNYASEIGYLKLPAANERYLDSVEGAAGVGGDVLHPNAVSKYGARVNVTTPIGRTGEITLSTGYVANASRIPDPGVLVFGEDGAGYRDAGNGYEYGFQPYGDFATRENEAAQHFTGSVNSRWTPLEWLTGRATAGLDLTNDTFDQLTPAGLIPGADAERALGKTTDNLYSVDLGVTADLPITPWLRSATSVGGQYHRESISGVTAVASELAYGITTLNGVPSNTENSSENVLAGAYAEERLGFNNRLFVTGAVRTDGANYFGSNYKSATYPKVSGSWMISEEPFFPRIAGLSSLRLRSAYGESGKQPSLSLTTLGTGAAYVDGMLVPGAELSTVGNPNLQPERDKEFEGGGDVDLVHGRVHLEFTYYSKKNINALYQLSLPSSLGGGAIEENVGAIRNWGYEAFIAATPIDWKGALWTITANGSINHNQLVSLAGGLTRTYGQYGFPSLVPGYPLYSEFDLPILGYKDLNGDGILEPNEITIGTTQRYVGPLYPPTQATLATHLSILHQSLSFGAQFDYRGGFRLMNNEVLGQCFNGNCFGAVSPHASLAEQAANIAATQNGTVWGLYSDAEFIRFRELSMTYTFPDPLAHRIGARSLQVTLEARNLALWTRFQGADPEENYAPGTVGNGAYLIGGVPPAQYWLARVNIGF